MDPNQAWNELLDAVMDHEWDRVVDLSDGLGMWLQRGGAMPSAVNGAMSPCQLKALLRLVFAGACEFA